MKKQKPFSFCYDVSIRLELDESAIDSLIQLSESHYDGVCKSAGRVGGFLYGWRNRITFAVDDGVDVEFFATNRELQTLCKITELAHLYPDAELRTAAVGLRSGLLQSLLALEIESRSVNGIE